MAHMDQTSCLTAEQLVTKYGAGNRRGMNSDIQNCLVLNGVSTPGFAGPLIKMEMAGEYYYMSSRNNKVGVRYVFASIDRYVY